MKKFILSFLLILPILFSFGCKKEKSQLLPYVTELKQDVFLGEENLSAYYGYKTENGNKKYSLTFKMKGNQTNMATTFISLYYKDRNYRESFSLSPLSDLLTASLNIDDFTLKEFSAVISSGSESHTVVFKSELPENTLSPNKALCILEKSQADLLNTYKTSDGDYSLDITLRVLVKKDKPYYYVGLKNKDGSIKAFLLDGITGDVLATREIF